MSADNWAECPGCIKQDKARYEKKQQDIKDAYGKVPADKYLAMVDCLAPIGPETNENLREDYQIGIWNGQFCVIYKARCERCGFGHSFTAEELIDIKEE